MKKIMKLKEYDEKGWERRNISKLDFFMKKILKHEKCADFYADHF